MRALALFTAGCVEAVGEGEGTVDAVQDDTAVEAGVEEAASPEWVKVFTWKAGGESDFIRNSK